LPARVDEVVIDDAKTLVSDEGSVDSPGSVTKPGESQCVTIPPHYFASPKPNEDNIKIDYKHDDLGNAQEPKKEVTRNNETSFCGRAYTRGLAKESHYWVTYHVEVFVKAHYLRLNSKGKAPLPQARVLTIQQFLTEK